jgi:hypothetical protein
LEKSEKLTDNEIIKALKHCYEHKGCSDCLGSLDSENCILTKNTEEYIYPIINRLQAENEKLSKEVDRLSQVVLYNDSVTEMKVEEAKAEAYKEFADRLKEKKARYNADNFFVIDYIPFKEIDNTLKELVGEDK